MNVSDHAPPHAGTLDADERGQPDEQLVARICGGEQQLFALLMQRHNRKIYRAARAVLRNDEEAEDVMQEAYVRAFEHLAEFRAEARFSTWLTRIAVHEALARARRARRFERFEPSATGSANIACEKPSNPEQEAWERELRRALDEAVDALPHEFRVVFVLRGIEQMSGAETAAALGIPEQTVKTRLFRARARLQRELAEQLAAHPDAAYAFHLSRCTRVVEAVMKRIAERDEQQGKTADD